MPPTMILNRQTVLMAEARSKTTFDPRQLTSLIYGGEENVRLREVTRARVQQEIGEDGRQLPRVYKSRSRRDLLQEGLRAGTAMLKHEVLHGQEFTEVCLELNVSSPFGLHAVMFIPTIQLQGDREQQGYWVPLAESGTIIGTYCQTELAHGSFIRGLETTARLDVETDEIVIHSPTPTSTKYWSSAVGCTASHAIVMARLQIREVDYGVHAFIVQLRSLDDGRPLPGVELGDMGTKLGLNGNDSGYVIFNHVRIPRRNMMMGQAKLARDGTYTPPPPESYKHAYITMIYAKAVVISTIVFQLAKAITIAIRYSTVREQGTLNHHHSSQAGETPIIAYQSQKFRLLTVLARTYALKFASRACSKLLWDYTQGKASGDDAARLAYLHATLAGMKAYSAQTGAHDAEDSRRVCGGHGYSVLSGLPDIVCDLLATPTMEGDNHVMYQQTARYLVKQAKRVRDGRSADSSVAYLVAGYAHQRTKDGTQCPLFSKDFGYPENLLDILHHRAARCIFECEERLRLAEGDGSKPEVVWNKYMLDLILAARYHIECFVLEAFIHSASCIRDVALRRVLMQLCTLYALTTIESPFAIGSSAFLEDRYISRAQLEDIRDHVHGILDALAPEAIGLTDAWDFSDASLKSALGRKDGNVYEILLDWTKQIPSVDGLADNPRRQWSSHPYPARSRL